MKGTLMSKNILATLLFFMSASTAFAQYTAEWTSSNLGQYGWGGAYGYDIDNDGLVEFQVRSLGQIVFRNGSYGVDWSVSFPGYDYVSVVQPRDIDGDGLAVPLNTDNDGDGEIFIVGYYYDSNSSNYYGRFRVYSATGHTLEFESPSITGFAGTASQEDIDGDGRDELIITRFGSTVSSMYVAVYAYSGGSVNESPSYHESFAVPCHPNPATNSVNIPVSVDRREAAFPLSISIYDMTGRLVKDILQGKIMPQGLHTLSWDGTNEDGSSVPAGTYCIRITKGENAITRMVQYIIE